MEERWDNSISALGRDVGLDEANITPLRRCKFNCCYNNLSTTGKSPYTKLKALFKVLVSECGGPKKVPHTQPLQPQWPINSEQHSTRCF